MRKALALLAVVLILGCLVAGKGGEEGKSGERAARGDVVEIDYQAFFQDGVLFDTTYRDVARNASIEKVPYFNRERSFQPLAFTLGSAPAVPAGLQEAIVGMRVGEEKVVEVPPEKGYGIRDEKLVEVFSRRVEVQIVEVVSPGEFYSSTGSLPTIGETYEYDGLPWNVTVLGFTSENVTIRNELEEGMQLVFSGTSFNTSVTRVMDGKASLLVEVQPYTWVLLYPKVGIVMAVNDEAFVVDFNHPAANATLIYKVRLANMSKVQPS